MATLGRLLKELTGVLMVGGLQLYCSEQTGDDLEKNSEKLYRILQKVSRLCRIMVIMRQSYMLKKRVHVRQRGRIREKTESMK